MRLVLLHSPLVGPATWLLLAPVLERRGHHVVVPDLRPVMRTEGPYYRALADVVVANLQAPGTTALVVHSGAGALAPGILQSANSNACTILVDALMPHPGKSWFDTAPEQLKFRLLGLEEDGRVPAWHHWFPKGAIEAALGAQYEAFAAQLSDLPVGYLLEKAPPAFDLVPSRCAYLRLSESYASDADMAQARGWSTRRLRLSHLAVLTHAQQVGEALDDLILRLAKD